MNKYQFSGRWILIVAALYGAIALVLSASSAHALKALVGAEDLARIQTANQYLMYYALLLLVLGLGYRLGLSGLQRVAAVFTAGSSVFCGSLYILGFTKISNFAWLVPLGGLLLLAGWLLLGWTAWRQGNADD